MKNNRLILKAVILLSTFSHSYMRPSLPSCIKNAVTLLYNRVSPPHSSVPLPTLFSKSENTVPSTTKKDAEHFATFISYCRPPEPVCALIEKNKEWIINTPLSWGEYSPTIPGNGMLPDIVLKGNDITRVINARRLKEFIKRHNITHLNVTKKYVYPINGQLHVFAEKVEHCPSLAVIDLETIKEFVIIATHADYFDWRIDYPLPEEKKENTKKSSTIICTQPKAELGNIIYGFVPSGLKNENDTSSCSHPQWFIIDTEDISFWKYPQGINEKELLKAFNPFLTQEARTWLSQRVKKASKETGNLRCANNATIVVSSAFDPEGIDCEAVKRHAYQLDLQKQKEKDTSNPSPNVF